MKYSEKADWHLDRNDKIGHLKNSILNAGIEALNAGQPSIKLDLTETTGIFIYRSREKIGQDSPALILDTVSGNYLISPKSDIGTIRSGIHFLIEA